MRNDYPHLIQADLDALAMYMDDEIRESVLSAAAWGHPGEILTEYLSRDPDSVIGQEIP